MIESLKKKFSYFYDIDVFSFVSKFTLILFLLHGVDFWYLRAPITVIAIIGICIQNLRDNPWFWFVLLTFTIFGHGFNWHLIDNHKYLMTYWCSVLFVASLQKTNEERSELLKLNGRLLIGLCMGFGSVWKMVNLNYMSGDFFTHTLLSDPRFENFASAMTSIENLDLREFSTLLSNAHKYVYYTGTTISAPLLEANYLKPLSLFMTWWTVVIEFIIAVLFLLPEKLKLERVRSVTLILFAVSTYSIATVKGFGWLLCVMGIAQTSQKNWLFRPLYFGVILLIVIYTMPWGFVGENLN